MLTISLLSEPGARRRISSPVLDAPKKWVILDGSGYREECTTENGAEPNPLPSPLSGTLGPGEVIADATPHLTASAKLALLAVVTSGKLDLPDWMPWEGATAAHKRTWLHLESMFPPSPAYSLGLTPQMLWGCLVNEKYPGEEVLVSDSSQSRRHLEMVRRVLIASGHPQGPRTTETPQLLSSSPPPPGAGLGFFSWTRQLTAMAIEEGPSGRGWGRISQESREHYHVGPGRNDPGMLRIAGFSYATTEGVLALEYQSEADAILAGMSLIDRARYTANIVVESVAAFKLFSLLRAAVNGLVLPDWLIYPPGRCWLTSLSKFTPRGEADPHTWLMRTGVACGEKACSRLIAEPGSQWMEGTGNPGIAARTMVASIVKSPYFQTGLDSAPDLISRSAPASI